MRLETAMARRKKLPPPDIVAVAVLDPELGYMKPRAASTRDDPLWGMLNRRQIKQSQFAAGRRWQEYRGDAEGLGSLRGLDTTREPVDGSGKYPEPLTDRQRTAQFSINDAKVCLGSFGSWLLEKVLWERRPIKEIAEDLGWVRQHDAEFMGRYFRLCLEQLARLWRL